eukprot:TRINITY_DN41275_c0_g1_i1.p1 TRINITY_DN41275_c0_g1~~TRINITY_DN41275_c0_g1_i1.p1  ORF type:complete len:182 (+),score=31.11 TRINITY_DN41275_c0_g1_i1:90-635(+)
MAAGQPIDVPFGPDWLDREAVYNLPPMHRAAAMGNDQELWHLIQMGQNVNVGTQSEIVTDKDGKRENMFALRFRYATCRMWNLTPLHCALITKQEHAAGMLLNAGARMSEVMRFEAVGFTPVTKPMTGSFTGSQLAEIFRSVHRGRSDLREGRWGMSNNSNDAAAFCCRTPDGGCKLCVLQ